MTDRLLEIARRIQGRPWNTSGSDKTWVLHALDAHRLFRREVEQARRVDARTRAASEGRDD